MKRLDQLARGLVVAGVDRVEHLVDELGAQPILLVDRAIAAPDPSGTAAAIARSRPCRSPRLDPVPPSYGRAPLWRNHGRRP